MLGQEGWASIGNAAFLAASGFCVVSCVTSFASMYAHLCNYRRPHLQRIIIRIFWMVPIYAFSSCMSLLSKHTAEYIETIRDLYEAFVIYAFFNLLVAFLGGERQLLANIQGRPPIKHMFPVSIFRTEMDVRLHFCLFSLKIVKWIEWLQISNPKTFLAMRRGILQFVFLKPVFSFLTLMLKQQDNYSEGYISITSSYVWVSLLYNVSVSWSMYCLVIFFFACREDLKPFRPVPKFLCIKAVILFAFYQGVIISILVYTGVITEAGDYKADNIAQALQDFLISFEMMFASFGHLYAFSHKDYIATAPIVCSNHDWIEQHIEQRTSSALSGRLSFRYALRDAIGMRDIVVDFRHTIKGTTFKTLSAAESLIERLSDNHRSSLERFLLRYFGIRRRFHGSGRVVTIHGPGYYDTDSPLPVPHPSGISTSESVRLLADEHERRFSYTSFSDEYERHSTSRITEPPLLPRNRTRDNGPFLSSLYEEAGLMDHEDDDTGSEISLTFREDRELEVMYDQVITDFPDGDYLYPVIADDLSPRSLASVRQRLLPNQPLQGVSTFTSSHMNTDSNAETRPVFRHQSDKDTQSQKILSPKQPLDHVYESFDEQLPEARSPNERSESHQRLSTSSLKQSSTPPTTRLHPYLNTGEGAASAPLTADIIKQKPEMGPPILDYGHDSDSLTARSRSVSRNKTRNKPLTNETFLMDASTFDEEIR